MLDNNILNNGISFLVSNGLSPSLASNVVKQANKDINTLPIDSDIESIFKSYLKLSLSIEYHKQNQKQEVSIQDTKRERRNLEYYNNRIKLVIFEYK
jgi:hypothetical protein